MSSFIFTTHGMVLPALTHTGTATAVSGKPATIHAIAAEGSSPFAAPTTMITDAVEKRGIKSSKLLNSALLLSRGRSALRFTFVSEWFRLREILLSRYWGSNFFCAAAMLRASLAAAYLIYPIPLSTAPVNEWSVRMRWPFGAK